MDTTPLTLEERELIYRLWCTGLSQEQVARLTGRGHGTVCRTITGIESQQDWGDLTLETGGVYRISEETKERVRQLAKERLTHKRIAEITGVSKSAVGRILKPDTT